MLLKSFTTSCRLFVYAVKECRMLHTFTIQTFVKKAMSQQCKWWYKSDGNIRRRLPATDDFYVNANDNTQQDALIKI